MGLHGSLNAAIGAMRTYSTDSASLEVHKMRTYSNEKVSLQIDKIRDAMRLEGSFVAGCEQLGLLCSGFVSEGERANGIEQIAKWERWSFERLPDATVRFSVLMQ